MNCPSCGLINPESAQRCDCGYDFDSRHVERSYLSDVQRTKASSEQADFQALRWAAGAWGLVVGGIVCLAAWDSVGNLAWPFSWTPESSPQLNCALILLASSGLHVVGALLTPFFPRFGGIVMLAAAACTSASQFTQDLAGMSGGITAYLCIMALLAGPGVVGLLSGIGSRPHEPSKGVRY